MMLLIKETLLLQKYCNQKIGNMHFHILILIVYSFHQMSLKLVNLALKTVIAFKKLKFQHDDEKFSYREFQLK